MTRGLTNISLFTGAGGLDIGLESAGFKTLVAVESDKKCQETLEVNRPPSNPSGFCLLGDITKIDPHDILDQSGLSVGEVTLVSGGPPCQPYSTAGKRGSASDPRGEMFARFVNVIQTVRPEFFIMENVRGLLSVPIRHRPLKLRGNGNPPISSEEELGSYLNQVILPTFTKDLGYQVVYGLLNALDYGAPQDRMRLVFLGSREWGLGPSSSNQEGAYIGDLVPPTYSCDGEGDKHRWLTLADALWGLGETDSEYIPYSPTRAEVFNKVPPGKNWRHLRDTYGEDFAKEVMGGAYKASGGKVGFWRRLSWEKWSPTLTVSPTQKATGLCHPDVTRPLSVREYARVQGFPDWWEFAGSTADKYRQIGNAVPIPLSLALGEAVKRLK